jgi:hypothetical protein|nr:MAG TPA: Class II histocompatibility antigen, alpha domain [Caudoviricetes sp.]
MYYKVLKNDRVIDVLDNLVFVKYQKKHNIMIGCLEHEAQAIVSSDGEHIWHVDGMYRVPIDSCDTVQLEEIDEYEYRQLKVLNMKTPEEVMDETILMLIEEGIL